MLTVRLLGQFNVQYEDTPILLPSRPAQSLLARLVLTAGIAHRREKLAGDQWPDASEANALSNLRHALWRIRSSLKRAGTNPDAYISANDMVIRFNADAVYWLDALVVEQESKRATATLNDLMQAAAWYQGQLLPGFYDEGSDWATLFRSQFTMAFDRLMARLVERLRDEACWSQIVEMGRHWAAHGELQESAYRELMIAHGALGDLAGVRADYRDCAAYLHKELGAEPSPETRALFDQVLSGAYPFTQTPSRNGASATPAQATPRAVEPPPNNLPQQVTPFVGRAGDLKDIAALLARPDCRLITLLGPGGVGKTRLAIKAASAAIKDMPDAFSDGVYFARLDAATTSEGLLTALSDAVRHVPFGQEHPKTQLLNFLREKKMLLVLDNFEQLLRDDVDGASLVDEVLATAQGVKALVTSRERLHLPSEHLVEVDGLDYPDDPQADDLERFGAVQLFLQAAQRILSRFSFQAEKASVARICRLTQGMPLALELAAAWVRTLACKEIAARIEHNLDVLAATEPDLSDRHRSVRAVLDYSWQLLSSQERNAFAALSVFRGGFELDAAEDVARTGMAMLYALVDKSLLRRSPAGRYDMHDLVRRYGEEKLDASEDEDYSPNTVHARMARYFLQFAQTHGKDYPALEPEWANFLAAMRAAHERYEWSSVTQMAQALTDAWFTRARFSDAREGLKMASEAAAADDDLTALANVLRWRGRACIQQDAYDEANALLVHAIEVGSMLEDKLVVAQIQMDLGYLSMEMSDNEAAQTHLMQSIPTLEAHGDTDCLAEAWQDLALLKYRQGDFVATTEIGRKALTFVPEQFTNQAKVMLLWTMAMAESELQHHTEAQNLCKQAVGASAMLGDPNEEINVMYVCGQVQMRVGNAALAQDYLNRCISSSRKYGRQRMHAHATLCLSYVQRNQHAFNAAIDTVDTCIDLYEKLSDKHSLVFALRHKGDLFNALKNANMASANWQHALQIAVEIRHAAKNSIEERINSLVKPG
jgi:predicted ATPase/DNA-binding SARP family transcriptional activator